MQTRLPTRRSDRQFAALAEPPAAGESLKPRPRSDLRILLVEDSEIARSTLRQLLELDGYHVDTASDGPTGIEMMECHQPDVALVDIGLPGLDGYQVACRIRSNRKHGDVYLVALTGFARAEDRQQAAEAGFDAHLAKPLDFDALEQLLSRRLQK